MEKFRIVFVIWMDGMWVGNGGMVLIKLLEAHWEA